MSSKSAVEPLDWEDQPPSNADVFFDALQEASVDYIFAVLGSDHASLIEAYERRRRRNVTLPEVLIFHHEFIAISAADSFARITGKPQCVLVHVDVGTAALGQGLHNASSGKAPLLIFAGEAPTTTDGAVQGSRSEHVQWYQDVVGQDKIIEPYSRYSGRLSAGDDVKKTVKRAILMATTGCPGPVYLTATREVLAAPAVLRETQPQRTLSCRTGTIPHEDVMLLGDALLKAKAPLVITGYLGRSHRAVNALVQLANHVKGLQVFDSEFRYMSFPAQHPAKLTQRTGARPAIENADLILVLDADVPWIPTKIQPPASARIFHVDLDPRKENMRMFDIGAEMTWNAECAVALEQLNTYIEAHEALTSQAEVFEKRWTELQHKHDARIKQLCSLSAPREDGRISVDMLFASLPELLPADAIYASDVVTNQVPLNDQLRLNLPGTNLTKGGSGLGWAIGAAIGIKLASRLYDLSLGPEVQRQSTANPHAQSEKMVCCLTGDGSFLFSSPAAAYLATTRLNTPFLTIVVNNGGWKATRSCIKDVHPNGAADNATDDALGIDLSVVGPDYVGIAKAASGNRLWGERVDRGERLRGAVLEALNAVLVEKRGAILEVVVV